MNRAARRGNVFRARRTTSSRLAVLEAHRERSGAALDPGAHAEHQLRDGRGRFTGAMPEPVAVVEETRQQRRHAARQAAKKKGGKP